MDTNVSAELTLPHATAGLRPIGRHLVYKMRAGQKRGGGLRLRSSPASAEEGQFLARLAPALKAKTVYEIGPPVGAFSTFFERAIGTDGMLVTFEATAPPYSSVDVERLDDLVKTGTCSLPDFMRIDVGGAELDVVRGAAGTICRCHPAMYITMYGTDTEEKMALQREMHELLHGWGYEIEDLAGRNAFGAQMHVERILCTHPAVPSHILFLGFAPRAEATISVIS